MGLTEIVLIILGFVILVLSYALPMGKGGDAAELGKKVDEGLVRSMVEKAVNDAKNHINDMVEETLSYSMEKTERAMERLTNEKIMAVNEYSEQVLGSINKNHQEVIFLYDMLKDKHEKCIQTVSEADRAMKRIRQEVQDMEITVKEANASAMKEAEYARKEEEIGEEPEFVPISPEKVEVFDKVIQEAKEEQNDGRTASDGGEPLKKAKKEEQNYNNNDRILRLHKLGKSKTAIARELGLGVGEVKLVIDLFE